MMPSTNGHSNQWNEMVWLPEEPLALTLANLCPVGLPGQRPSRNVVSNPRRVVPLHRVLGIQGSASWPVSPRYPRIIFALFLRYFSNRSRFGCGCPRHEHRPIMSTPGRSALAFERTRATTEWPFARASRTISSPVPSVAPKTRTFMFDLDLS